MKIARVHAPVTSVVHESDGLFKTISHVGESATDPFNCSRSVTLRSFLRNHAGVEIGDLSRLIAGDVSIFDSAIPNSDLRISSVPTFYRERSLSLTSICNQVDGEIVPPPVPAERVLLKLLEKAQTAVCIIDPVNKMITAYNRIFAELWALTVDTQLTWYGLPLRSLKGRASAVAASSRESDIFLSFGGLSESVTRVLRLADSNVIEGSFEPVWLDAFTPYRVIAQFSRLNPRKALRQKELSQNFGRLTSRQKEVLLHVAEGKTNAKIAKQLGIVVKTVEKHRSHAFARLGVGSVPELVRLVEQLKQETSFVASCHYQHAEYGT